MELLSGAALGDGRMVGEFVFMQLAQSTPPLLVQTQLHCTWGSPSAPGSVFSAMQDRHDDRPGESWNENTSHGKQSETVVDPSLDP
mmetsp:Transcript_11233/g.19890  ORF Transcript_11233/g.19890 Transcript_11233/m.19890 type:complete len:86 (+) Transcript_11233:341-598(+)